MHLYLCVWIYIYLNPLLELRDFNWRKAFDEGKSNTQGFYIILTHSNIGVLLKKSSYQNKPKSNKPPKAKINTNSQTFSSLLPTNEQKTKTKNQKSKSTSSKSASATLLLPPMTTHISQNNLNMSTSMDEMDTNMFDFDVLGGDFGLFDDLKNDEAHLGM